MTFSKLPNFWSLGLHVWGRGSMISLERLPQSVKMIHFSLSRWLLLLYFTFISFLLQDRIAMLLSLLIEDNLPNVSCRVLKNSMVLLKRLPQSVKMIYFQRHGDYTFIFYFFLLASKNRAVSLLSLLSATISLILALELCRSPWFEQNT